MSKSVGIKDNPVTFNKHWVVVTCSSYLSLTVVSESKNINYNQDYSYNNILFTTFTSFISQTTYQQQWLSEDNREIIRTVKVVHNDMHISALFTTQRYASEVYAVVACLCVLHDSIVSNRKQYALYRMVMLPMWPWVTSNVPKPPQFLHFALPFESS